jgi:hypothetical protein
MFVKFKSVDSVIKPSFARHLKACNWYANELRKKWGLTKNKPSAKVKIVIKSIITKHEIWVKQ